MPSKSGDDILKQKDCVIDPVSIEQNCGQNTLDEHEGRWQTLIEATSDWVWEVDVNGIYTYASSKVKDLIGYEASEVIGKPFYFYFVDKKATQIKRYFQKYNESPKSFSGLETISRHKNGTGVIIECSGAPALDHDGNLLGWRGFNSDITARKLAEKELERYREHLEELVTERTKALQESEEKYRSLVELSPDPIIIFQDNRHKFANPAFTKLFGYTIEEMHDFDGFHLVQEGYKDIARQRVEDRMAGRKISKYLNVNLVAKDGRVIPIEITGTRIKYNDRPADMVIIRDITQRIEDEKEKATLQAQLQQAQKMEAIGMLAGGVAHDLNNILSGLVSYPELLLIDLPQDSPIRKPIMTIQKSGQKAAAIVQDLLTLARRGVSNMKTVDINHIVTEYLSSPEYERMKSNNVEFHVHTILEPSLLPILGSPVHLIKTVMNLITNAVESMPSEGMITICTENRYVDRPIRGYDRIKEGDYVVLKISDTGMGIADTDLPRIFEPFYSKKMLGTSGTGLGMAVVWGTVKDHNGYIDVTSGEGKGTTFTLYFPVTRQIIAMNTHDLSIKDYMGNGESVLVVDDVMEQREIATAMLKKLGYTAASVSSGEEAIERIRNDPPDLLILDMIMPNGLDGLETFEKIKELNPNQKAIIASGFSESERVKKTQNLGAGAYIKKPYTLEKLGLAIKAEFDIKSQ